MQLDKMLALSYNHCKYPIVSQKIFLVGVEKPFQLSFQLVTRQLFSMGHEGDKLYISCWHFTQLVYFGLVVPLDVYRYT